MTQDQAAAELVAATAAMFAEGVPLMRRLLPSGSELEAWANYPGGGLLCPASGSRAFYHVHPPGEREAGEHGHFHFFLPRSAMDDRAAPLIAPPDADSAEHDFVHIAALAIDASGLPLRWFTVNRWVTDEWLFPATAVSAGLGRFSLAGAGGDALVNRWLTAAVHVWRPVIVDLLERRDARLAAARYDGEDRALEVLSSAPADLDAIFSGEGTPGL